MNIDDLLEFVESLATDHKPEGWPAIQMQEVTALADEIKRLRAENERILNHAVELSMTAPKGYAIVPIEPTKSMIDAGYLAVVMMPSLDEARPADVCYRAMIEAAQEGE